MCLQSDLNVACVLQSEKSRELAALRAEEEERLTTTLANQMQEQERSSREIQRLREQSEELRE